MAPRTTSVCAALRRGGRKAPTPFEIASTPVSAAAPDAKARMTTSTPTAPTPAATGSGMVAGAGADDALPDAGRDQRVHGDDERVRREGEEDARLAHTAQVRQRQQDDEGERELTLCDSSDGTADVRASTPAATETATVRT